MPRDKDLCFTFILLGVLWVFWICSWMSSTNLGKFSVSYCFKYLFCSFYAFFFWYSHYARYTFVFCPIVLGYCFIFFFSSFSLCFSVLEVSIATSSSQEVLSSAMSTQAISPSNTFLISVTVSLIFIIPFWFVGFPILYLYYPSVFACCLLCPLNPLIHQLQSF